MVELKSCIAEEFDMADTDVEMVKYVLLAQGVKEKVVAWECQYRSTSLGAGDDAGTLDERPSPAR